MADFTIPEALQQAVQHHQAGHLPEAETIYREILARDSRCVGALHGLGILALQVGRHDVAAEVLRQAAALVPADPAIHSNLGEAYRHLHHLDLAVASYRQALALQPDFHNALGNLGLALTAQGKLDEAVASLRRAIALKPDFAEAYNNLGNIFKDRGQLDDALACFRQAVLLQPQLALAHSNLGLVLHDRGRPAEALVCFRQALAHQPDLAEAHNNLGLIFKERGQLGDALACYERALALKPNFAEAHNNVSEIYADQDRLDDAVASLRQALALQPNLAAAHNNLGNAFKDRGQLDEAIACFRRAVALEPGCADYHSSLILTLHYRSGDEVETIDAELRRWHRQHAEPVARFIAAHANDRSPDRRLRIGYVSHDFRRHSIAFFLLPLLQAHDRERWHVTAYATNLRPDDVTARFRVCTDSWRSLVGFSDEAAAQRIRDDRIDVLIDLSGHTGGNRLPIFAYQPAPVQVTYLGYPGSTGLGTMDYRLTDAWADPPGATVEFHSEQLVRLPDTAWCFAPLSGSPPVGALPALRQGHVTFGCFNNFAKVTDNMLQFWARILRRAPGSRLALKNLGLSSPPLVERLKAFMSAEGITADRLELIRIQSSQLDHLRCYDRVDLALDTFPYHGTTTTCEALWMGVPVLTLAGDRHASRVGVSLLTNVGLPEFVTHSANAYVDAAVAAAGDLPRLTALRASLRERMQRSPLMDAPRFARNLENAYRVMWRRWCAQPEVG
jgi:protein O-GlcNAc transferase